MCIVIVNSTCESSLKYLICSSPGKFFLNSEPGTRVYLSILYVRYELLYSFEVILRPVAYKVERGKTKKKFVRFVRFATVGSLQ